MRPAARPAAHRAATLTRGSPGPGWLFPSGIIVRRARSTVRRRTECPVAKCRWLRALST